jgi:hypothetical protein
MKALLVSLVFIIARFQLTCQEKVKPDHGKTLTGIVAGGSMATNFYDYGPLGGEPPAGVLSLPAKGLTFDFESKRSFPFLIGLINHNPLTVKDLFFILKSLKIIKSFTPSLTFTYFIKHCNMKGCI